MEIVRFAGLIYRSTKIPASHVALLSSIQVNDRADVALLGASGFGLMSSPAPRSGLSRSDLVANSVSGMVRPRALAVLRLITNSILVGCRTGRSAGFSPF